MNIFVTTTFLLAACCCIASSQTPPPTAKPPSAGTWNVTYNDNKMICILLNTGIQLTFKDPETNKSNVINVPSSADSNGTCEGKVQSITLWFPVNDTKENDPTMISLSFTFAMESATSKYDFSGFILTYKNHSTPQNFSKFPTEKDTYFKCTSMLTLFEANTTTETHLQTINLYNLKFEAFLNATTEVFSGTATTCDEDHVSQLVPIIVGAVLAGLIVVVLIAYLIGRRQSKRGYESV